MFKPDFTIWLDFESAGPDVAKIGVSRYAGQAEAIVLAWAIDKDPVEVWHMYGDTLDWAAAPPRLKQATEQSDRPVVAWNCRFDRHIWNRATFDFPYLPVKRVFDGMVQAAANNLPINLDAASTRLGGPGKQEGGKALIRLFCIEKADPADYPEKWQQFLDYARQDVEVMRAILTATRPLPDREWAEFLAFEQVNDYGMAIDLPFVTAAAEMAEIDKMHVNDRLRDLTDGKITAVTQATRIAGFLHENIEQMDVRAFLTIAADPDEDDEPEDEDDGAKANVTIGKTKLTIRRNRLVMLRLWYEAKRQNGGLTGIEEICAEIATLREFGGSSSPLKFRRIVETQLDGIISGQYVFNGAGQTGRASSRGVQIHNLTRDAVGTRDVEAALIDALADGVGHQAFTAMAPATLPVARKLGLIVRPAFVARNGRVFCWSDWNAIEARIVPWLSKSQGGDAVLDVFRSVDANPKLPDVYMIAAGGFLGKDPKDVNSVERQMGKIAVLALGFGGAKGALKAMAAGYGVLLDDEEADRICKQWRADNPWAVHFWGVHQGDTSHGLWGAAMRAWEQPGEIHTAGRIGFVSADDTLYMALPSGRLLVYPSLKWRDVPIRNENREIIGRRVELSFVRGYGRTRLSRITLTENATQACAADLLRGTVKRLVDDRPKLMFDVCGHTHDEIVTETDEPDACETSGILHAYMVRGFPWSGGLPLAAEETTCAYYTKAKLPKGTP